MATFVVTTTTDELDNPAGTTLADMGGANDLSLREAVALANANGGVDVIAFDPTVFTGGAASLIRLTQGEITITDALTIDGSTGTGIVITGDKDDDDVTLAGTDITDVAASGAALLDDNSRVFKVSGVASATTLKGLTVTGGHTSIGFEHGGGIQSEATLTIIDSTIAGNSAGGDFAIGGGVFSSGSVSLTNATVSGNATLGQSSSANVASGGGIATFGDAILNNSTVTGNSTASTVAEGGGVYALVSIQLTNTIVLGNRTAQSAGDEIQAVLGTVSSDGLSIVGANAATFDTTGIANIINANPTTVFAQTVDIGGGVLAGVLADNGGSVQTVALKLDASNPALDASNSSAPASDANGNARFDQSSIANANGSVADLGASEAGEFPSLVVTTNLDVVDAVDGLTSLREAVAYANGKANVDSNTPDTITFDATVFTGGAASLIRLTNGELSISDSVVIDGKTGVGVTVTGDANGDDTKLAGTNITDVAASSAALADNSRLFAVNGSNNIITLKGLTLTGGHAQNFGTGGAIRDFGLNKVLIEDSEISGNKAAGPGGALFLIDLTISNSTVSDNQSDAYGGGISVASNLILTSTTVANNTAGSFAGGLFVQGASAPTVTITNSTITGNKAAGDSGGIYSNYDQTTLVNSIVLGNDALSLFPDEIGGLFKVAGLNIVGTGSDTDASDGMINANPATVFAQTVDIGGGVLAGVLANNGGTVQTVALKLDVTNPALDRSNGSAPATDARGTARQDLNGVGNNGANFADLGAFEAIDARPSVGYIPALLTIAENTSTATRIKVADFSITDTDGNNTASLSGADAGFFEIENNAIYLKAGVLLDFETKKQFNIIFDVQPLGYGVYRNEAVLTVTDVNEAPTALAFSNVLASIAENASTAARRKVADITITDDALGTETITLTGADASKFEIFDGDLYLKAGATLDFETNPKLDVTVNVDDTTLGSGIELSRALSVTVTDVLETISGSSGSNTLNGTSGADRINAGAGNDTVNGGAGDDIIYGGAGVDRLTGGTGRDTFVFKSITESGYHASGSLSEKGPLTDQAAIGQRDIITDFTPGFDEIDLSAIDANTTVSGNQAFTFRGTGAFAGAGSLVYRKFDNAGTANDRTVIFADANGDGRSDFQIELKGLKILAAGDFVL